MLRPASSEKQVAEWDGAATWSKAEAPYGLSHAQTLKALNWISTSAAALEQPGELAGPLFDAAVAFNRKNRTRRVVRLCVDFCIGSVIHHERLMVMTFCVDAMHAASVWGGAKMHATVKAWIENTYRRPATHLDALDASLVNSSRMRLLSLSAVNRHLGRRWAGAAAPSWLTFGSSQEWRRPPDSAGTWAREIKEAKKDKRPVPTRLTSLTPAGARLFPWLLEFCERPA